MYNFRSKIAVGLSLLPPKIGITPYTRSVKKFGFFDFRTFWTLIYIPKYTPIYSCERFSLIPAPFFTSCYFSSFLFLYLFLPHFYLIPYPLFSPSLLLTVTSTPYPYFIPISYSLSFLPSVLFTLIPSLSARTLSFFLFPFSFFFLILILYTSFRTAFWALFFYPFYSYFYPPYPLPYPYSCFYSDLSFQRANLFSFYPFPYPSLPFTLSFLLLTLTSYSFSWRPLSFSLTFSLSFDFLLLLLTLTFYLYPLSFLLTLYPITLARRFRRAFFLYSLYIIFPSFLF